MSEFGKGLTYCLGLFLAHAEDIDRDLETYKATGNKNRAYEMWFYAASDHLYDFLPEYAPNKSLKKRCKNFKQKCLTWRSPLIKINIANEKRYYWAIKEAKTLLRLIDRANGIPTSEGDNE